MEETVSVNTWSEAFEKYPIPTTRNVEKQLRSNVSQNKTKLRALVG